MTGTGIVHGRFQPFHNDHLRYVLAARERCRHLIVGVTNPDPSLTRPDPADPGRSDAAANPLTYFERYTMVRAALLESGLRHEDFSVVPLPINLPELYRHYVPLDGVFYLTIYDEWGRRKLELFRSLGLAVEVLWERPLAEKGITAADVRDRMARGQPWEHLVPPSAADLMKRWNVPERLRLSASPPDGVVHR